MFFFRKPAIELVNRLVVEHRLDPHSYTEVEATRNQAPAGYNVDHNRVVLGRGRETFQRAMEAIGDWRMFDLAWISLFPVRPAVKTGETVAVVVRHLGFFSLNISRVVYVIQEESRYGFAYGTTMCHGEQGEERFFVEHDVETDEVSYDLYSFSRPRAILARLGYPVSRKFQKRFARESLAAMQRAMK